MNSLQKALDYCWDKNQNPFIIGGSSIYEEAISHPNLDGLFLTLIHGAYKSDVFFPQIPENLKIMLVEHYLNYSMFTFIKKSISWFKMSFYKLKLLPQPQVDFAIGLTTLNPLSFISSR